ncbi:MAG: hypothetical protein JO362_16255 [Streptomycetaceae bacterium]|nr:hypothetical protein [Streptomycetaceae bacterium]
MLAFTLAVVAAIAVQWCHATYAGAAAFLDVIPATVATILAMVMLLYWLHGSVGQCFVFFPAAMLAAMVGGFALSNAIFAARGVVSSATITDYANYTDGRTSYSSCQITLHNGTRVARPIRCDEPRIGQHVTVTIDPDGLASPAFGDRTKPHPVILWIAGTGLAVTVGTVIAATWTGERLRLKGEPSVGEAPNPMWYPRRRSSPEYGSRRAQ